MAKDVFFLDAWKRFTADKWILDLVRGIKVDFVDVPRSSSHRQIPFSDTEGKVGEIEVEKLRYKQVIEEVEPIEEEFVSTISPRPPKRW